MIAVSIVDAKKKSVLSFFLLSFFPSVSINCKNFKNGFFDRMESNLGNVWRKTCIGYEIFSIRLLIIIIIATCIPMWKMNGAIYYARFVAIRLSQATRSTYFANTVKTHPFCTDASKQSFFFFYSVPFPLRVQLQCSNSTNRSTIDPLYWQLVCSPNFVTASFSPNEIHLFLLWNCVLIQQISLSIYLSI